MKRTRIAVTALIEVKVTYEDETYDEAIQTAREMTMQRAEEGFPAAEFDGTPLHQVRLVEFHTREERS